jgi:hypothetical protein
MQNVMKDGDDERRRPEPRAESVEGGPDGTLAASAVSGQVAPAGLLWVSSLAPLEPQALATRYLAIVGEATEVPRRSPGRGPPYGKSRVLRRKVVGGEDEGAGRGHGAGEEVA